MRVEKASVGARGFDSVEYSMVATPSLATRMAASGLEFFVGYLGTVTPQNLQATLSAGMAFMPVGYAGAFNGTLALAQVKALGIPPGCTVWCDLEGDKWFDTPSPELMAKIDDAWAAPLVAAGYECGIYVGSPQPLSGPELYALRHITRYWNALSREVDHEGHLAEPQCGWTMWQMGPSVRWRSTGVLIDIDVIGQDFKGRLPSWAVRD